MDNTIYEGLKSIFGVKNSPNQIRQSDKSSPVFDSVSHQAILNLINILRQPISERSELYEVLKQMMNDSLVGAAVELMSSDASQIDVEKGHVCWAVSSENSIMNEAEDTNIDDLEDSKPTFVSDKENEEPVVPEVLIAKDKKEKSNPIVIKVNNFLYNDLDIDSKLFTWAYQLVSYGEVFLRTYYSDIDEERKLPKNVRNSKIIKDYGKVFDIVDNPLNVKDILEFGETVGYLYIDPDLGGTTTLYSTKDFIHILSDKAQNREKATIKYCPKGSSEIVERVFKVKYGSSYIAAAREAFEILQLLELILIVSRFNRSALYRLFKVEVAGASRSETSNILSELKRAISKSEAINIPGKQMQMKDCPIPYGGNIYLPTRNQKGDVQVETVGGDMDLRDILDIDYYQNKLLAALKVPKAFLGIGDENMSGIGNSSLIRMDIRYARTIKSIVSCLQKGIKDVCDYYLLTFEGVSPEDLDKYEIKMATILTADEVDRQDSLNNMVSSVQQIMGLYDNVEGINKERLAEYCTKTMLSLPGLWDYIKLSSKEKEELKAKSDDEDNKSSDW